MRADLVLLADDPTKDIRHTTKIMSVWKNDRLINREQRRAEVAGQTENPRSLVDNKGKQTISDFESGKIGSEFGAGWMPSTDSIMGGQSKVIQVVIDGGANGTKKAMQISGVVHEQQPHFSGVLFSPADIPMQPADISSHGKLSFWAKGNGEEYQVMLFSQKRGMRPSIKTFQAPVSWREYTFQISDFDGCDGTDVLGIWFGSSDRGNFKFEIDEVQLRSQ